MFMGVIWVNCGLSWKMGGSMIFQLPILGYPVSKSWLRPFAVVYAVGLCSPNFQLTSITKNLNDAHEHENGGHFVFHYIL